MSKEKFEQHVQYVSETQPEQQKDLLIMLKEEFNLVPMESPFEYAKAIQKDFDDSKVKYSNEYYDVLGLDRPDGTKRDMKPVEFPTVKTTLVKM